MTVIWLNIMAVLINVVAISVTLNGEPDPKWLIANSACAGFNAALAMTLYAERVLFRRLLRAME